MQWAANAADAIRPQGIVFKLPEALFDFFPAPALDAERFQGVIVLRLSADI